MMRRWVLKHFSQAQWARKRIGGKWELIQGTWLSVEQWSEPRGRPEVYSSGVVPLRENWNRDTRSLTFSNKLDPWC